jgi:uncharacterized protein (TIGR03492 family)
VPLVLATLSGAPFTFVGTAKSEYLLRDENGLLLPHGVWESWSGSVYYPWERWMMSRARCRAVFPRDRLTTEFLQKWQVPAFAMGNPMMDELEPKAPRSLAEHELVMIGLAQRNGDPSLLSGFAFSDELPNNQGTELKARSLAEPGTLRVLLLPGSRPPEAYENWQQILQVVQMLIAAFPTQRLIFLGAISPNLSTEPLCHALESLGWQPMPLGKADVARQALPDATAHWFTAQGNAQSATLVISQHAYADCLHQADCAIAMAGTATEQFVGLGKPAIILPGRGPQFTGAFAQTQTYLLGESALLVKDPNQVAPTLEELFNDAERLQRIAKNGRDRMGEPGAAQRIADCLLEQLNTMSG